LWTWLNEKSLWRSNEEYILLWWCHVDYLISILRFLRIQIIKILSVMAGFLPQGSGYLLQSFIQYRYIIKKDFHFYHGL
jgi:hypothetical protein